VGVSAKQLTLAVNSGIDGDALKRAALDYEAKTGVHINTAKFPYTNLFEKELVDLSERTGAYHLMMNDELKAGASFFHSLLRHPSFHLLLPRISVSQ
jgi:hypothetical protein